MDVSKVVIRAPVASFRHPFFVTGRQPTYDIPPPSTIFGHCASAVGSWPDPRDFFFGLHFRYRSKGVDLEHQHIAQSLGPRAKTRVPTPEGEARATHEITVQPVAREFLFGCEMTLYLPPLVGEGFRSPCFPVVLGRSQDLAEVVSIEAVALRRPSRLRLEHTLLPRSLRPCVRFGTTVLLSSYISEPPERRATFEQYISLHEPVFFGPDVDEARAFLRVEGVDLDGLWMDPSEADEDDFARGIWLHRAPQGR